jgi:imidazolonepropionase-like amidohydrolase
MSERIIRLLMVCCFPMPRRVTHDRARAAGRRLLCRCAIILAVCTSGCAEMDPNAFVIRAVTVLPMTGAGAIANATVVVRDGRIASIDSTGATSDVRGLRVVDGTGKFLVPGLIEMHAHLSKTRASALGLFVRNGVTTVRDMGGDHQELLRWRADVQSGTRFGPRILLAGPYLESQANIERMRADPPEERVEPFERARIGIGSPERARQVIDSLAALELDYLKIRTVADRETYLAINQAAEAHGLDVVGHVTGLPVELVLEAGQDGIEHFFYPTLDDRTRDERLAIWREFAARGVAIVPTLVTFQNATLGDPERLRAIVNDSLGQIDPRRRYLSNFLTLDWREQALELVNDEDRAIFESIFHSTIRNTREMHEAGMDVLAGSDVAVLNIYPGSSLHEELGILVDSIGMSPMEALSRATARSAAFLGIADSVGTVEAGMVADLILVDGDPRADIRNLSRISAVILRGRLFDSLALDALLQAIDTATDRRVNDWRR